MDKYNPKSSYYNDICSKATSESGTDIPLKDRMNEFVENNMTLCEENCDLIDYDKIREKPNVPVILNQAYLLMMILNLIKTIFLRVSRI